MPQGKGNLLGILTFPRKGNTQETWPTTMRGKIQGEWLPPRKGRPLETLLPPWKGTPFNDLTLLVGWTDVELTPLFQFHPKGKLVLDDITAWPIVVPEEDGNHSLKQP